MKKWAKYLKEAPYTCETRVLGTKSKRPPQRRPKKCVTSFLNDAGMNAWNIASFMLPKTSATLFCRAERRITEAFLDSDNSHWLGWKVKKRILLESFWATLLTNSLFQSRIKECKKNGKRVYRKYVTFPKAIHGEL